MSPQRAVGTFFVKNDQSELAAFWIFCSMHAVMQVPPDEVVGSRDCRCHPFAALTICFNRPAVLSLRASRAILHSRQPADCILPVFVSWLATGVIPVTYIPKRLLRLHGICL